MGSPRHFLRLKGHTKAELEALIDRAIELKALRQTKALYQPFVGRVMALLFEKASTRTRISFEAGFAQMGGSCIYLNPAQTQLRHHESIEDTARVTGRMVDLIMIRTFAQERLEAFAAHSEAPVINGLTNECHPCQIMGDLLTIKERRGSLDDLTVTWIGDASNVLYTWLQASEIFGFRVNISAPFGYKIDPAMVADGARVRFFLSALEAASGSDVITTDRWASSGYGENRQKLSPTTARWQVNSEVMAAANPNALFLHCLPAFRGQEVTTDVIDGPQSAVWDEAENRMHVQKAIMERLLLG